MWGMFLHCSCYSSGVAVPADVLYIDRSLINGPLLGLCFFHLVKEWSEVYKRFRDSGAAPSQWCYVPGVVNLSKHNACSILARNIPLWPSIDLALFWIFTGVALTWELFHPRRLITAAFTPSTSPLTSFIFFLPCLPCFGVFTCIFHGQSRNFILVSKIIRHIGLICAEFPMNYGHSYLMMLCTAIRCCHVSALFMLFTLINLCNF